MSPIRSLSLQALVDGGLGEDFDRELQRVIENIGDPNTDPKKARTITVKISLKPINGSRNDLSITEKVDASLAGPKPHERVAFADDAGIYMSAEGADPRQRDAFEPEDDTVAHLDTQEKEA